MCDFVNRKIIDSTTWPSQVTANDRSVVPLTHLQVFSTAIIQTRPNVVLNSKRQQTHGRRTRHSIQVTTG